jgi:hypothetical protein
MKMNKELNHRISYYTRKVAEKASVNLAEKHPRWSIYRNQKLLAYKKLCTIKLKEQVIELEAAPSFSTLWRKMLSEMRVF